MEEEKAEKEHLLVLDELVFQVQGNFGNTEENVKKIKEIIVEKRMYPYYLVYIVQKNKLGNVIVFDDNFLQKMKEENAQEILRLEKNIEDARENLGQAELLKAFLDRSLYLLQIGENDLAIKAFKETLSRPGNSVGQKIDILFHLIRMGFGFNDIPVIRKNIKEAKAMIELGGDWERKNRLKVYEGAFYIKIRDFRQACDLLLGSISTFSCFEFMEYREYILYTILMAMVSLDRNELKKDIINSPDVLTVIDKIQYVKEFTNSFFNCQYDEFFKNLLNMESLMRPHRILASHTNYFIREMRAKAYNQFLESYKSVTLESMASRFGITSAFMDKELAKFIAAKRINCRIDKVGGVIITTRPKKKNEQYSELIKKGDIILGRIQKLSRVVDL